MKVKLVSFYNRFKEYPTKYSLGTMRLAAYLKKNSKIDVSVVPIDLDNPISEQTIKSLSAQDVDILGIPNFIWTEDAAKKISREIKNINPSILKIIGGPNTPFTEFKEWNNDEIFVLGEGEEALLKICEAKISNDNFTAKNIDELNAENIFSESHPEFNKKFLFQSPYIPAGTPLFSQIAEQFKEDTSNEDFAWYETSRGCIYNCGYCGHKSRSNLGHVDLEQVREEIEGIKANGIKKLFIVDPIIGGNKQNGKNVIKLCNEIIPETKLIIYLRPEMLDDEYIKLLSQCNLDETRFGIQTLNTDVPTWIRSNSISKIGKELSKLYGSNIDWKAELIVGLPGDTLIGLKETIKNVISDFQPTVLAGYHLTAIKGTRLYNLVDGKDKNLWLKVNDHSQAIESYSYSAKEFKQMAQYSVAAISLYNLIKEKKPNRKVSFDLIDKVVSKHLSQMDSMKLEGFDSEYAKNYWKLSIPSLSGKTLTIMRHGQSVGNQKKVIQGTTDNYGLSAIGIEQIQEIVKQQHRNLKKINHIITSPTARASETGAIIQSQLDVPIITNPILVEVNPGILSGNTHEYNHSTYPEHYKTWMNRKDLDGIPGAEKGKELQARVVSFLANYLHEENFSDLVVSHAGFIRCLVNTVNGVERTTPVCVDNGNCHKFYNPLRKIKFEQRTRAMASEVYIVTTTDDKYVVKLKDRNICNQDINEKQLLDELRQDIDGIPSVLNLNNTKNGCIKVLEFVEGKHLYGILDNEQKTALTEKIVQISQKLNLTDTSNYSKHDLHDEMIEKEKNSQNTYVKALAQDILNDSENVEKLKKSPYCLVHSDLNRDNILFQQKKDNKWTVNVIDWEGVELLPKDYQLASYLSSSLLIENESIEDCMKIAKDVDKNSDEKFLLFLMKIRLFGGIHYFAENQNSYTQNNEKVSNEILNKYFMATKKIKHYEMMSQKTASAVQHVGLIINPKQSKGK